MRVKKQDIPILVLLVVPGLVYYLLLLLYPLAQGVVLSFYRWPSLTTRVYGGLFNYRAVFDNPAFWNALKISLVYMIWTMILQVTIGYILGYMVYMQLRFHRFFKTVLFMPNVLTMVAVGFVWAYIFGPSIGILKPIMALFGMADQYVSPLAVPSQALGAVIIAQVWNQVGIQIVLFNSGFMGLNEEVLESASIDGASGLRMHLSMILPLSLPIFKTVLILQIVGSLRNFDLIFTMTKGGPNHSTEVLPLHLFTYAFTHLNLGYGSVIGVVIFILAVGITGIVRLVFRRSNLD